MTNLKTYKAIDLVEKILEFRAMTPNSKEWNFTALRSNPPRYIRLQQIVSLMNALVGQRTIKISSEKENFLSKSRPQVQIKALLSGNFIKERTIIDYKETIPFINDYLRDNKKGDYIAREIQLNDLVEVYQILINYKNKLGDLLNFNSGWLEAPSAISFAIYLTNSITNNLADKCKDLDKALELLINPKGLTFTEKELKKKYNYPSENLDDVDLDNI